MLNNPNLSGSAFISEMAGLQVKFSPFNQNILAYCCAQNFGIAGKDYNSYNNQRSKMPFLIVAGQKNLKIMQYFNKKEIVTAGGKGTISLWNLNGRILESQLQVYFIYKKAHKSETQSVEFNHKQSDLLLSSGSDGFVKIWDLQKKIEILQFQAHQGISYQTTWHPHDPNIFASIGQDGFMKIWDSKQRQPNILSFKCHDQEILCCDFLKYDECIVTGSIDKSIKLWDLRNFQKPVNAFFHHRYPVRKVKCSPFEGNIIASASYDMNVNIWDIKNIQQPLVFEHRKHTEFVIGLDFNVHLQRQIASTGYDGRVLVWNWDQNQPEII